MPRAAIPPAFLSRMAHLLGDEYPAFLASYDGPPVVGLRVNTLKLSAEAFRALAPFALEPAGWAEAGFVVHGSNQPGKHPYHAAGLYYLQDPAAMVAAELLAPRPGERVLDLAAAPGGKATHLAALMRNQGLLVANEIHPKRAWDLAENLERCGARNALISNETPERLAGSFTSFFDRVMVDAPCSGEGMFRRSEAARVEWAPELVAGCSLRQAAILDQAADMVRPGGWLAYATCTFEPEEDEGTVARFLRQHRDFEVVEPPRRPGFGPGRPEWVDADLATAEGDAAGGPLALQLARAVRLWPHRGPGEGHFVSLLRRKGDSTSTLPARSWSGLKVPPAADRAYRTFCEENLATAPGAGRLTLVGSYLYAVPEGAPSLAALRFIHPGWWLGIVKGDRFEPSHALALGLSLHEARRSINLTASSPETLAYLRGETLSSAGEDGWLLLAVDGYPLGWGKRTRGVVKNHYPRGLRWA